MPGTRSGARHQRRSAELSGRLVLDRGVRAVLLDRLDRIERRTLLRVLLAAREDVPVAGHDTEPELAGLFTLVDSELHQGLPSITPPGIGAGSRVGVCPGVGRSDSRDVARRAEEFADLAEHPVRRRLDLVQAPLEGTRSAGPRVVQVEAGATGERRVERSDQRDPAST